MIGPLHISMHFSWTFLDFLFLSYFSSWCWAANIWLYNLKFVLSIKQIRCSCGFFFSRSLRELKSGLYLTIFEGYTALDSSKLLFNGIKDPLYSVDLNICWHFYTLLLSVDFNFVSLWKGRNYLVRKLSKLLLWTHSFDKIAENCSVSTLLPHLSIPESTATIYCDNQK